MCSDVGKPPVFRSLASKISLFTAILVSWVVFTILAYDLGHNRFNLGEGVLLLLTVVLVAAAIGRFTIRLLARPLALLQSGITSAGEGRLEPIQVSETGDEIQALGESFNKMIAALGTARSEIESHQRLLDERIEERTEDLQQAVARSEAANRAKSEFLADMSHELRTPMNGVIGMIEIALESKLAEEQSVQLETAQRCAYTLLALLNDILDLSKIEAGKMLLEQIPVNIRALVRDCVHAEQRRASQKGIALGFEVDPDVPVEIAGDPLRLRQIIGNLLNNAVKFTSEGSVSLKLTCEASESSEFQLRMTVSDTGMGIEADQVPFIFDKFTQVDRSISRKYRGTGLGLAITKNLVQMHGGDIRVESELGQGTTFQVTLPAALPDLETHEASGTGRGHGPAIAGDNPCRILVVEDNVVNQKVASVLLEKRGYRIEVAQDGQQALDRLEQSPCFDLVLMDVEMPGLDGLETVRLIRQNPCWRDLPIVALTARAMRGDRERCIEAGMDGYVSKPVQPFQLFNTIEQFLTPVTQA